MRKPRLVNKVLKRDADQLRAYSATERAIDGSRWAGSKPVPPPAHKGRKRAT